MEVERVVGDLQARMRLMEVAHAEFRIELRQDRADLRSELREVKDHVSAIHEAVTAARGGWKMLGIVGAVMVGVAGIVTTIYHFFVPR